MVAYAFLVLATVTYFCEAFTPQFGNVLKFTTAKMQRAETPLWTPTLPKLVDLTDGPLVLERGVEKSAFESFFSDTDTSSYYGYKLELLDNNVCIYDMVDMPHEKAIHAFDCVLISEAIRGNWLDNLRFGGSGRLKNPSQKDSDWQPDGSYFPDRRLGPVGSTDGTTRYPTMVLEVASSETDNHVKAKAIEYLGPNTSIQIVLVLLIRPNAQGADRLKALKYERGHSVNPCWECSFADPQCIRAGDPAFRLPLPINLLFDNAPTPAALAGKSNVELDLFLWKDKYLW